MGLYVTLGALDCAVSNRFYEKVLAAIGWIVMDMTGTAMPGMSGIGSSGTCVIMRLVNGIGCCTRKDELLLLGPAWLDPVSQSSHGLFDLLPASLVFVQGQAKTFGHDAHLDPADSRQTGHGVSDLACT